MLKKAYARYAVYCRETIGLECEFNIEIINLCYFIPTRGLNDWIPD